LIFPDLNYSNNNSNNSEFIILIYNAENLDVADEKGTKGMGLNRADAARTEAETEGR
jgi:hypothetical protein